MNILMVSILVLLDESLEDQIPSCRIGAGQVSILVLLDESLEVGQRIARLR